MRRLKMNIKILAFLLLMSFMVATPVYAEKEKKEKGRIDWSEVPLQAQQAITKHKPEGTLVKVKKEKIVLMTEDGKKNKTTIYLAGFKRPGEKRTWVTVDKNGNLVDIEDEEFDDVLEDQVGKKNKKNR